MTEEIIDSVDVSGCIYKKDGIADCGMLACGGYKCEGQICLYKQLKRLEAENAKLKSTVELIKEYALDMEVWRYIRKDLLDIIEGAEE